MWPFWDNINSWWATRNLPNVHFVHLANLKKDMDGKIRHIAEFLETPIDETKWPSILRHCRFDYMKEHATKSVPLGGAFWDSGAQPFIHKGVNWPQKTLVKTALNSLLMEKCLSGKPINVD